jgi:hypothetical protein
MFIVLHITFIVVHIGYSETYSQNHDSQRIAGWNKLLLLKLTLTKASHSAALSVGLCPTTVRSPLRHTDSDGLSDGHRRHTVIHECNTQQLWLFRVRRDCPIVYRDSEIGIPGASDGGPPGPRNLAALEHDSRVCCTHSKCHALKSDDYCYSATC